MPRQIVTYAPVDRPDVEVEVDGEWLPGELRQQVQEDDGTWRLQVQWRGADRLLRIEHFPAERVRRDEVDRSRGRTTRRED